MTPREAANNAYAQFWGDKQRALWYVMVFLEWSIMFFQIRDCVYSANGTLGTSNKLISRVPAI